MTINGKDIIMTLDMNKMGVVFWKQKLIDPTRRLHDDLVSNVLDKIS